MKSLPILSVALAVLITATAFPAAAPSSGRVTLHLHSLAPVGNANVATDWMLGVGEPTMDENAPTSATPKIAHPIQTANNDRKSLELSWWAGAAHGNVGNVTATLFVRAEAALAVEVTLFGDGGYGTTPPLARGRVNVAANSEPSPVTFTLAGAGVVDREVVLSVWAPLPGVQIFYDAADADSRVSFDLGPFVGPPPAPSPEPAPGWNDVVLVSSTLSHRETSLAIDPTDEDHMFLCAPSGTPNTQYGQSYFHQTKDAGATWNYLRVETEATDGRQHAYEGGDCDVAFDAAGTMYSADTWLGDLSVGRSFDDGVTWSGTPVAVSSPIVDRPWLVGGPGGTIHLTYQDLQAAMPTAIWYTKSTDHGATFAPATPVVIAGPSGAYSWEGNFVVSPDGLHLYLVYTIRQNGVIGVGSSAESVWVAASHDAGVTWTPHRVANTPQSASYLYPSIAMDGGGMLHVVYAASALTGGDHPIWYATSMDGAQSWSAPLALKRDVAAFSPWVAAGPTLGEAAIQWYGSPQANATSAIVADWYEYAARVSGAETGTPTITAATTTTTPLYTGRSPWPEFNQVRLDSQGNMRIGASVYHDNGEDNDWWALVYQTQAAP